MKKIERDTLEVLQKNIDLAESRLNTAPSNKVDKYLEAFMEAKHDYLAYLNTTRD